MRRHKATPKEAAALRRRYTSALRSHVKAGGKPTPDSARRLGEGADALGVGPLGLARIHDAVYQKLPASENGARGRRRAAARADAFFAAVVAPLMAGDAAASAAPAGRAASGATGQRGAVGLAAARRRLDEEKTRRKAAQVALKECEARARVFLRESKSMEDQLRRLTRRVLTTQEDERRRISRELHDALGQTLTGINLHLAALKGEASVASKGLRGNISRTQRLVQASMKAVHRFASELRPNYLDDCGLVPALRALAKEFGGRDGVRLRFHAKGNAEGLGTDGSTALFRVAQEALSNIGRHSKARNVLLTIVRLSASIRMVVWNDGKSFDVKRASASRSNRHLGLLCMRERVEMVGGEFSIQSSPDTGTFVRAEVPIPGGKRG